jgi:SAM-dependent methyltransferase
VGDDLITEQIDYYRNHASDFRNLESSGGPLERHGRRLRDALDGFEPRGRILEIACGTGAWTEQLLLYSDQITALDAAPEMIAAARRRLREAPNVHFEQANVFDWVPEEKFDLVFFANWLSHVPPERFASFWHLVKQALVPGGRFFLIDVHPAAWRDEALLSEDFAEHFLVRRTANDGTNYRVIKVFWEPGDLGSALVALGWDVQITTVGPYFWAAGSFGGASHGGSSDRASRGS